MLKTSLIFLFLFTLSSFAQGTWSTLKTGAGGWITGMDIHPSGHPVFIRSDVGGAYRYQSATNDWKQIVTSNSMPAADLSQQRYKGVLSIVSAPSNANRAYMAYIDAVYRSDDQGENWIKTNLPITELYPNDDESKLSGERLSVDPLDENIIYLGSIEDGLFRSFNGGESWENVSAIPIGITTRGVREIKFDSSSGDTDGKTNGIYVMIDGEGVYHSVDAGITWTNLSVPVTLPLFLDAEITADGNLYLVGQNTTGESFGVLNYSSGSGVWQSLYGVDDETFLNIAVSPFNPNRAIILSNGFSETYQTENLLAPMPIWNYKTKSDSETDIPWLSWITDDWFTIGEMVFDPVVENKLWIADGIGIWTTQDLEDDDITWVETSKGQEHLVSNDIIAMEDGSVVTAHWDRPLFLHTDFDAYPETHLPYDRFNSSWSLDQCMTQPNFLAAIVDDHRYCCFDDGTRLSGYSEDGGVTWTKFESMPGGADLTFGLIAVSAADPNNMVWLPTFDQPAQFTLDKGVTWNVCNIPGASDNCCLSFNFLSRLALTADAVAPNTFYMYDFGNGAVHKTTDGGANWVTQYGLDNAYAYNGKLTSVPGKEGHLFFTNGIEESEALIDGLQRSVDGGLTWETLPNTDKALNVTLGAPEVEGNYPTLYFQGEVDGEYGYFKSDDEGENWTLIGKYPLGIYDVAKVMEANPFIPGLLYVGFGGNGFVYYQDDLLDITDNAPNQRLANVYPNPTNGNLNIISEAAITNLYLFSPTGQLMVAFQNTKMLDLSDFSNGVYYLQINFENGNQQLEKVILQ